MSSSANSDSHYDPLLICLAKFTELYSRPVSIDALVHGLPIEPGKIGPELFSVESSKGLFSRVASRAGYSSRLIERDLDSLSTLLLPCILVLKDDSACILEEVDLERGRAKVILPELEEAQEWVSLDKLKDEYLGYAFLLKKKYKYQARALSLAGSDGSHWFWGTLARSKEIYLSVILASLMINLFILATPLFTMNVYDRVVPNDATETLWVLAIGVFIVYTVDMVLSFMRNYLLEVAGKKADVIMSSMLFEQTMGLRMDAWPKSVGAFANNLREFESIRSFCTSSTLVTLVDLPFTLIFLAVIAYIGGVVVLVPLTVIVLLLIYSYFMIEPLKKSVESTYAASANKHALLVESLHSINTIKTMGVSQHSQWEWEEATGEIANKSLKSRMLAGSITMVTHMLVQLSTVGILIVGVYQLQELNLTMGGLIAAVILSSRAISPMGQVASLIANFQQTKTAYNNLDQLMQLPVERPADVQFVRRPEFTGKLALNKVSFNYPDNEWNSLDNISLEIKPGERVGIIGKVGSGKTTLTNLLVGLHAPHSGSITFDDIEAKSIDPADLRRSIAYLSQDATLFRGSIRENITFKEPHIHDEALLAAAHVGGVDLFVNQYPKGYDTPVGEQGHGLSGGQRQCLALSRTLLLDTPIVILDEPTNAMDNTTESIVRKRLQAHTEGKTLIIITHKPAMLELVDRLIVVDRGRIVMDGDKEKVIAALQGGANG